MSQQASPGNRGGPEAGGPESRDAESGPDESHVAPRAAAPSRSPVSPLEAPAETSDTRQHEPFGASLEPALRHACAGRLGPVSWFRTDWQRGGALTGYAVFADDHGHPRPSVVKLPVPPQERTWLARLQSPACTCGASAPHAPGVAPHLFAHGETLNGYDFAWVVMERLPHGPLGAHWHGAEFDLLIEAAGRFYAAAKAFPLTPGSTPLRRDWEKILHDARGHVHKSECAHEQRWHTALKKAHKRVREWAKVWEDRPIDGWCHGDLHLGNAMTRAPAPNGPALLFDFALTRPGHWVEDAVNFEHLWWCRRQRLGGRRLCSQLAHERKKHGLPVDPSWPRLASIKRALLAMSTPAQLQADGDPHHVEAALQVLEIEVGA